LTVACTVNDIKGNKILTINNATGIELDRAEPPEIVPFDTVALKLFENAIENHDMQYLFSFASETGLRRNELLGLKWDDIKDDGSVIISRQITEQGLFVPTKGKRKRKIFPTLQAMSALISQKKRQAEWQAVAGELWSNQDGLVFTNTLGVALKPNVVSKAFKRLVRSIGFPNQRLHDLRHGYATTSLHAGANVISISKSLGHHLPSFTYDVYCNGTEEMQREDAVKREQFMNERVRATSTVQDDFIELSADEIELLRNYRRNSKLVAI
jgi:integrase